MKLEQIRAIKLHLDNVPDEGIKELSEWISKYKPPRRIYHVSVLTTKNGGRFNLGTTTHREVDL